MELFDKYYLRTSNGKSRKHKVWTFSRLNVRNRGLCWTVLVADRAKWLVFPGRDKLESYFFFFFLKIQTGSYFFRTELTLHSFFISLHMLIFLVPVATKSILKSLFPRDLTHAKISKIWPGIILFVKTACILELSYSAIKFYNVFFLKSIRILGIKIL